MTDCCAFSAQPGVAVSAIATASGLAAATRREREEMLIIFNNPLKPAQDGWAKFTCSGPWPLSHNQRYQRFEEAKRVSMAIHTYSER
jgi:hypothetical protein